MPKQESHNPAHQTHEGALDFKELECDHRRVFECSDCEQEIDALIAECEANGGHDWIDNSTAGPDSGNITLDCSTCPAGYRKTLY